MKKISILILSLAFLATLTAFSMSEEKAAEENSSGSALMKEGEAAEKNSENSEIDAGKLKEMSGKPSEGNEMPSEGDAAGKESSGDEMKTESKAEDDADEKEDAEEKEDDAEDEADEEDDDEADDEKDDEKDESIEVLHFQAFHPSDAGSAPVHDAAHDAAILHDCFQHFACRLNGCLARNHGKLSEEVLGPMMEEGLRVVEVDGRPAVVLQCMCPGMCFFGRNLPENAPVTWEEIVSEMLPEFCLGVFTMPVPESIRTHFGLKQGAGLWVEYVVPNSPAHKAGIHRGDVLLEASVQMPEEGKLTKKVFWLTNPVLLMDIVNHVGAESMELLVLCRGKEHSISLVPVRKAELMAGSKTAPAETSAETPAETPAEAPAETPAEAPAETPAEAPAEAPAETPAEVPAAAPILEETPAEGK